MLARWDAGRSIDLVNHAAYSGLTATRKHRFHGGSGPEIEVDGSNETVRDLLRKRPIGRREIAPLQLIEQVVAVRGQPVGLFGTPSVLCLPFDGI